MEAMLGKLRTHQTLSVADILRHYFTRHAQVSLFTYWLLAGSIWLYQMRNDARDRESRSAALQAELATAQLAVLRAQLHPHFLFNTLQAATALIHEDPDGAEDVLLRLSEFLRVSLEEVDIQEVSLNRELEVLELYVGIQVRRFGDRLSFEVSMDDGIGDCAVPSLILQPLVENAICHGIGKRKGKDTVSIKGYKEGDYLRLEVRNLTSRLEANPVQFQDGVGLANTRSRLEHLYGDSQKLCLTNLEPEGVSAEVSIPFRPMALRDKHE